MKSQEISREIFEKLLIGGVGWDGAGTFPQYIIFNILVGDLENALIPGLDKL
jgi:hypothetical protein